MSAHTDVRELVSSGRMTPSQTITVAVAIFLNVVDGYDVLVMAFTSAGVSSDFDLGPGALGLLLSASLFGMFVGSVGLAPIADRIGRRPVTLAALASVTVFMGLSAMAPSAGILGGFRFLTGLGIGAMLPNLSTFVSEFSTRKWRESAVTLNSLGYALGATVGGLIAVPLIASLGWRSAFWLGAAFGLIGFVATYAFVPESIHYLVSRRPADAVQRINVILSRMGRGEVSALPDSAQQRRAGLADVFRGQLGRTTVMIWIAFFCVMASFYFANSWTPKLLAESGLSEQQGIVGGILLSVGGVAGALAFALLALKMPAKYLEAGALIGGAGLFVVFALTLSEPMPALIAAVLVGFFINATVAGMYAVVTTRYPTAIRGTGVGWAVGMGRIGAILSPTIAGWLLAAGLGPKGLFFVFLLPMLVGAVAILAVGKPVDDPTGATAPADSASDPVTGLAHIPR
jgi:benzoate transport